MRHFGTLWLFLIGTMMGAGRCEALGLELNSYVFCKYNRSKRQCQVMNREYRQQYSLELNVNLGDRESYKSLPSCIVSITDDQLPNLLLDSFLLV